MHIITIKPQDLGLTIGNDTSLEALNHESGSIDFEIKNPFLCRAPEQKENGDPHHHVHATHDAWPDTIPYLHSNLDHMVAFKLDNPF
jgi:hypothetical protein